jgi:hypothetical protein
MCLAFVAGDGKFAISPPIWKHYDETAGAVTDDDDSGNNAASKFDFNSIDTKYSVNLNFALKAAKEIGTLCGYDSIEPLDLPRLMTELCTVNLPNIPQQVKATYDIGMAPSHAVAWLLGISRSVDNLQTLTVVRTLLKHVMGKGLFERDAFTADAILFDGMSIDDVRLMSIDELKMSDDDLLIV